jgi:FkbM family methyltransferase
MQSYGGNKFKTALDIYRRIDNWPAAFDLRIRRRHPGLRLLRFRDGFNVVCRGGTRDWDVVYELMFAGSYGRAFDLLRRGKGRQVVLDLGGNIGLFSLLAARQSPEVEVHAYEPGPPNYRLFEMNRQANHPLSERIHLHREAVGGAARETEWFFDENNPGGSSLFGTAGTSQFKVKIITFAEAVNALGGQVALAKIDIEGAEFELLDQTPPEVWKHVNAISLELHHDPAGKISREEFMARFVKLGFHASEETACSYFLERR